MPRLPEISGLMWVMAQSALRMQGLGVRTKAERRRKATFLIKKSSLFSYYPAFGESPQFAGFTFWT
jgi:hypothetical protein